jgi:queuine tRNA-ribosyltransferase
MFDCVLPTRSGRNGQAFTHDGPLNLRNAAHAEDLRVLDVDCHCPVCCGSQAASRAYLHHLIKAGEMLGAMLLTQHNIGFYQQLMAALRAAIGAGTLDDFAARFLGRYNAGFSTRVAR